LQAINRENDATTDHDKMLETLAELQKNLPMAIAKLKGTASWGNNLPLNMQIDRSEIMLGKRIGKGAYGLVHEASWLGCKFAVKIIEASDTIALQHEVGILAQLRHPHIVQLVGFSVDKGKGQGSMILMELMDGDLHQLIEDRVRSTPQVPPFSHYDTVHVISQIAAGMAYLHKKLVFHGDLKASNVLCNHRGGHIEAKITDFGVSQTVQLTKLSDTIIDIDGYSSGSIYSTTSLTGKVGTTGWRAPEVSGIQVSIAIKYKVDYFGEGLVGLELCSRFLV
jgi:serine/threonine protein kinase